MQSGLGVFIWIVLGAFLGKFIFSSYYKPPPDSRASSWLAGLVAAAIFYFIWGTTGKDPVQHAFCLVMPKARMCIQSPTPDQASNPSPAPAPALDSPFAPTPAPALELTPTPTPKSARIPARIPASPPAVTQAFSPAPAPPPSLIPAPPAVTVQIRTPARAKASDCPEKPHYPAASRRKEEEGIVILQLVLNEVGKVTRHSIEKSSGFSRLDDAVISILAGCTFQPATVDGKPEKGWARLSWEFKLVDR